MIDVRHVQVEAGIHTIGEAAWQHCNRLLTVHLKDGVFRRSYVLHTVTAPECRYFGSWAVEECYAPAQVGDQSQTGNQLAPQARFHTRAFEKCRTLQKLNFERTVERLQSLRVSQMGFVRVWPVSLWTKASSLPKVLCPPMAGSCSRTAVSNSSSRSNSWRSMITWSSSPDRVVNRSCNTSWRSLLTRFATRYHQTLRVLHSFCAASTWDLSLASRPCSL